MNLRHLLAAGAFVAVAALASDASALVRDRDTDTGGRCTQMQLGGREMLIQCVTSDNGATSYVLNQTGVHSYPRDVFFIFDDFVAQTQPEADTPWIENAGSDEQALDPAIEATSPGGVITLVTGDNSGAFSDDGSQIVSHIPVRADAGGVVFETRLHIDSAVSNVSVCAGFTDSTSLEEPASISGTAITTTLSDGVVLCYDTAATTDQWYCIGVDSDTDATGNAITGVAPVADTYQTLRIEIDADGATARCYIDGVLVGALSANATTPSVNLFATVTANATTTTSKSVDIDYIYFGHNR